MGDPHLQPRLRLQLLGAELALRLAVTEQPGEAEQLRAALHEIYARLNQLQPPGENHVNPASPTGPRG